ncbi:glycerol dehydrogenase [Nocardioides sp. LS1]|uniref:glycerol dehydrogenase n=1 Tax=Nocardioides sp. LS1 TaxID=1027620 RepID=UPI000FF93841|nr:glycerol dehydrogenase [Nocardioides sp. LS1]GCD90007.1 glycerol dehydrogenase [Nocardioides sp. LS1]
MTGVRAFAGPLRYVQGPDALDLLPPVLAPYGPRPLLVTDTYVQSLLGARLSSLLADLSPAFLLLRGEITAGAADALAAAGRPVGAGVVVGVGGGKALDAAKAVSLRLGLPVVTVPTVASNDSPTSGAVAMYDDDHRLAAVDRLPANPHAVVVDTALVAAAPVRFLRSGVGDAVAKTFEAAGCRAGSGVTALGTRPLLVGSALADACYAVLREHAVAGLAACERGEVDDSLEALVEAVVLLSGLGFENGGLSLAHSLTRGLMRARGASTAMHGEHVAWATLVQLRVTGASADEIDDLRAFLVACGLPVTLAGLGMPDSTAEEVRAIAAVTMTAPHLANLAVPVDEDLLVDAILAIEGHVESRA